MDGVWVADYEFSHSSSGWSTVPIQDCLRNLTTGAKVKFNHTYELKRHKMREEYNRVV